MGDKGVVIREEFALTPEQVAATAALMRRIESRIPALVADLGEMASAVANMVAALAPLLALLEAGPASPRPANPIGEQHGPCMELCVLTSPHSGQCSLGWIGPE